MKKEKKYDLYKYEQKKINHVFHYTRRFDGLEGIIRNGFLSSYCKETIGKEEYLTPMVSFCNIPISEVDKYARYGKNGIGLTLDWAIKNKITPVTYVHETSPFNIVRGGMSLMKYFLELDKNYDGIREFITADNPFSKDKILEMSITTMTQYLKNWKIEVNGEEVVTYQEREWRFIPSHKNIKPIISKTDSDFKKFLNKNLKPKPHLKDYPLVIDSLSDINYIVVTTPLQRKKIVAALNKKFDENKVKEALMTGTLSIFSAGQIRNDF